jgi:hypothetical protein
VLHLQPSRNLSISFSLSKKLLTWSIFNACGITGWLLKLRIGTSGLGSEVFFLKLIKTFFCRISVFVWNGGKTEKLTAKLQNNIAFITWVLCIDDYFKTSYVEKRKKCKNTRTDRSVSLASVIPTLSSTLNPLRQWLALENVRGWTLFLASSNQDLTK